MISQLQKLFNSPIEVTGNFIRSTQESSRVENNQDQTKDIFSEKWAEVEKIKDVDTLYQFQFDWFLKLYGFDTQEKLAEYLATKKVIVDTGCGLGFKAAWFAKLSPLSVVIAIDLSDSVLLAAKNFGDLPNLFFLQADVANTGIKEGVIDFTVCDQVIMHTEVPELTFAHLAAITSKGGEFACYAYRKKALPRELVDDYFRKKTHEINSEQMWEFSDQLTRLGKTLSDLQIKFQCPDIPLLNIKGGEYDIQRFIYWNFLKCFWRDDWSFELSKSTNYDWYAPSNARRFSREEFEKMITDNKLAIAFFHEEEACFSGRFQK